MLTLVIFYRMEGNMITQRYSTVQSIAHLKLFIRSSLRMAIVSHTVLLNQWDNHLFCE